MHQQTPTQRPAQLVNRQRIGVYGGTFDPIHFGHLRVASSIFTNFALDEMLFVPAFVPPHKRGQTISAPHHRYAMLALATMNEPHLRISTIELEAPARPYTIETLGQLQQQSPQAQLFFVMGMDSFRDLPLWRAHEQLLREYSVIVATRPGFRPNETSIGKTGIGETLRNGLGRSDTGLTVTGTEQLAAHLTPIVQDRVVDLRGAKQPTAAQLNEPHTYITDYVSVDLAATEIRQAARYGAKLDAYVPSSVADYIAKYALYQQ